MGSLRELLGNDTPDMKAIASHLDNLGSVERVSEIRALGRVQLARLFEAAKGHRPISLNDIVSSDRDAMQELIHYGKNSLPAFNHFA